MLPAATDGRTPSQNLAMVEIVITDHGKFHHTVGLCCGIHLTKALDFTGSTTLAVFEEHLNRPITHSLMILPIESIILTETLAPLLHTNSPVQTTHFFNPHHGVITLIGNLITQLKLTNCKCLLGPRTVGKAERNQDECKNFHKTYSSRQPTRFKNQGNQKTFSSCPSAKLAGGIQSLC